MKKKLVMFFRIFYQSFYSRSLYRRVGTEMKGFGFMYLLFLSLLLILPTIAGTFFPGSTGFSKAILTAIRQMPDISIINGEFTANVPQPYLMQIGGEKDEPVKIIIDTTGSITSLDGRNEQILITKTELIAKKNDVETKTMKFTKFKKLSLTHQNVEKWARWAWLALLPFIFFSIYVVKVVLALFYGLIGLILRSACGAGHLGYEQIVRLSSAVLTPPSVIAVLLSTAGLKIPFHSMIFFLLTIFFLVFALRSNANTDGIAEEFM